MYSLLTFIGQGTEYKSQDVTLQYLKLLLDHIWSFGCSHSRNDAEVLSLCCMDRMVLDRLDNMECFFWSTWGQIESWKKFVKFQEI